MIIKIKKEDLEWLINLSNSILKELKVAGLISENVKYFRTKFKNRKRESHSIKLIKDMEEMYYIIHLDFVMLKDALLFIRKVIHTLIPTCKAVQSVFNIFNNKDNDIVKEYEMIRNMWEDKYLYYIFDLPNDLKGTFFNNTKFIAKTIDGDEYEVVYVKYGTPKDNKKRSNIENDMKRTTNTIVQNWINDHMIPGGRSFETFEQAKYRLLNDDNDDVITIPQDEFKEGKK